MSYNNGSLLTLARPYAEAVFNFAYEQQALEKWELMLSCAKNTVQNKTIKKLLSIADFFEFDVLSELFFSINKHEFDCFFQNFIQILSKYKRLYLIPIIFDEFIFLRHAREMIIEVKIITASLLASDEISHITSTIEKILFSKINLIYELDQSIIGGIVIYVNNIVIDGSIQTRVKNLQNLLEC